MATPRRSVKTAEPVVSPVTAAVTVCLPGLPDRPPDAGMTPVQLKLPFDATAAVHSTMRARFLALIPVK